MKSQKIVDEIISAIPVSTGSRPWYERVDKSMEPVLEEILRAWHSGALGRFRSRAARAIASTLKRHGVSIGQQGVEIWLRRSAK